MSDARRSEHLHIDASKRVWAEYLEMPGMRLTVPQVERLCGLDGTLCKQVLDALVEARFLSARADGRYERVTEQERPRARPAKADLKRQFLETARCR